jgi:PBP1b-binding outer membrane lipoprotein LpoB
LWREVKGGDMKYLMLVLLGCLLLSGCDNPILNPDTSQAISHKMERKEYVEQTKALNRIAEAIEKLN